MNQILKLLLFTLFLYTTSASCELPKTLLKNCLLKFDSNKNKLLDYNEVNNLIDNMHWYEKVVYPRKWLLEKIQKDCDFPVNFNKDTCFHKCNHRNIIFTRFCSP